MGRGDRGNKTGTKVPAQTATATRSQKAPLSSKELIERKEDVKQYFEICQSQDWFYSFSEDHKVWKKGEGIKDTLERQSKKDPLKAKILKDFQDHNYGPGENLGSEPRGPKPELDSYDDLLQDPDYQVEPVLCAGCSKEIFEGSRMEFVRGFADQGIPVGPYHVDCKPTITQEHRDQAFEATMERVRREKAERKAELDKRFAREQEIRSRYPESA